jgi:hypothetical protein
MDLSIHNQTTRFLVSIFVFLVVLLLIAPHFMDVQPPLVVEILLKPAELVGSLIGGFLPHPNIGTADHPVYEGTPLDLLLGLVVTSFCILLYPFVTYLLLSLLSIILRRKRKTLRETLS